MRAIVGSLLYKSAPWRPVSASERLLKVGYLITIMFTMYYIFKKKIIKKKYIYIYLKFDKHLQDVVSSGPKLVLKRKF